MYVLDSVTEALSRPAGAVLVTGSHGGSSAARFALQARPHLVVFNDAGGGKGGAGIAALALLQAEGVAACTVAAHSACIGDAASTLADGVLSHANAAALALGATLGQPLRPWLVARFGFDAAPPAVASRTAGQAPAPDATAAAGAATEAAALPAPALAALAGLKVLELGQLIAGPFAARTLGDFGADVIKVEPPGTGDPLRQWRLIQDGTSVWWQVQSRNKRSVALDLRNPDDVAVVRALALQADVLVENFRPGALEGFGLAPEDLLAANPRLIVLRISGYGQTGPYRDKPGFGVVAEAMGGLRHLTAEPGRTPVRVGVSIGDTLAALHGVIGVLTALHERQRSGRGQVIDVALYEAVFNCMESLLPEYSAFGVVRGPAGSALPGIAPSNAYRCRDGHVLVAGNGDSIFRRLMAAIGRDDLGRDPALAGNAGRVSRVVEIDAAIEAWTAGRSVAEALAVLDAAAVPAGRIYTVADIAADPHYAARGMLQSLPRPDGSTLRVPGVVPRLSRTPGGHRLDAPVLGADTTSARAAAHQGDWPQGRC